MAQPSPSVTLRACRDPGYGEAPKSRCNEVQADRFFNFRTVRLRPSGYGGHSIFQRSRCSLEKSVAERKGVEPFHPFPGVRFSKKPPTLSLRTLYNTWRHISTRNSRACKKLHLPCITTTFYQLFIPLSRPCPKDSAT